MTAAFKALGTVARDWRARNMAFVLVVVAKAEGSTPREQGATMLVSSTSVAGTIGGGRLEWDAIDTARNVLAAGDSRREMIVHLGPAIGQCCGGRVTLTITTAGQETTEAIIAAEDRAMAQRPSVMIYGAGHVGRALARALSPLPFAVTLLDGRQHELDLADVPGVQLVQSEALAGLAAQAPQGTAHVVMTHSHSLDSLIATAVLEQDCFAYLGIIGSRTKRNSFRRAFREIGIPAERIVRVVCPIGGKTVKDKRPEVIAALSAAEIVAALLSPR